MYSKMEIFNKAVEAIGTMSTSMMTTDQYWAAIKQAMIEIEKLLN